MIFISDGYKIYEICDKFILKTGQIFECFRFRNVQIYSGLLQESKSVG